MSENKKKLEGEKLQLLKHLNSASDQPLFYLSFIWVGIIIFELSTGINRTMEYVSLGIWAIFIADSLLELIIAPSKKKYLQDNWLNGISLLLPALRILRIFQAFKILRAIRTLRSLNLLKIISSLNRSVDNLRDATSDYGIRYVLPLTALILFVGSAAVLFFENPAALSDKGIHDVRGIQNYGSALYWTSMLMTTIGSDYWPQTIEGKMLTLLLSIYSIAIFGYITATLASLLVKKNR